MLAWLIFTYINLYSLNLAFCSFIHLFLKLIRLVYILATCKFLEALKRLSQASPKSFDKPILGVKGHFAIFWFGLQSYSLVLP